jgi:DNA-3-methyladenine glycosylase II
VLCSTLKLKKAYSVEVTATPPYSFELTVNKPAGWWWSTPDEIFKDDTFWTATRFQNTLLGLKLESTGTLQNPKIHCTIFSQTEINSAKQHDVTLMLKRALRTEEDLTEFYTLTKKDNILNTVAEDLCGMRTAAWPELFPALILAVTLQMAPMARANQMMELLISGFGDQASFDGKTIRYWPSPDKIASSTIEDLMAKAKLGYRAKNLTAIAKTLQQDFPAMEDLWAMNAEAAKRKLLTLRGIGDYSADIIVPGMGFPIDVWSAKIFHILFFGTKPENPRQAISLLKQTAEKRWGKWQGYAFVYVLNDLPKLSKRIGVDLTQF